MVWVPKKISEKRLLGDDADAEPWPAGPAVSSAQSGGQPTGWVFFLPPLPLSAKPPISPSSQILVSLSDRYKEKNKKRKRTEKEEEKKERKRRRRKANIVGLGLVRVLRGEKRKE